MNVQAMTPETTFCVVDIYNRLCLMSNKIIDGGIPEGFHTYYEVTKALGPMVTRTLFSRDNVNFSDACAGVVKTILTLSEFQTPLNLPDEAVYVQTRHSLSITQFLIQYGCIANDVFPPAITIFLNDMLYDDIPLVKRNLHVSTLASEIGECIARGMTLIGPKPVMPITGVGWDMVMIKFPHIDHFISTDVNCDDFMEWIKEKKYKKIGTAIRKVFPSRRKLSSIDEFSLDQ